MPTEKGIIMAFWDNFLGSGIEGAAKGLGTLATDLRSAITGKEILSDETRLKIEQIANQLEIGEQSIVHAVNATMQVEAKSEHWPQWSWRPYWGFVSGTAFGCVCVLCCYLGYKAVMGGNSEALGMIPQLITAFAALFAIPGAILGVTAWHRGQEKRGK
jgi:hypothetical protein